MQVDKSCNEELPPNLRDLPLDIYPKIAACLDYVSEDLPNLCTALQDRSPHTTGNGEVVDKILGGNEDYLRHMLASTNVRASSAAAASAKTKILQWMDSNPNWTERCNDPTRGSKSFCHFSIHHSDYDKLNLHEYHPGALSFQGYVGKEHIGSLPREGDLLYAVGGMRASGWTMDKVKEAVSDVDVTMSPGWKHHFVFLRDANFIFSHPLGAILWSGPRADSEVHVGSAFVNQIPVIDYYVLTTYIFHCPWNK
jgi:hypothetical protein